MKWGFVSVDTKARKFIAGTHLVKVGSSNLAEVVFPVQEIFLKLYILSLYKSVISKYIVAHLLMTIMTKDLIDYPKINVPHRTHIPNHVKKEKSLTANKVLCEKILKAAIT